MRLTVRTFSHHKILHKLCSLGTDTGDEKDIENKSVRASFVEEVVLSTLIYEIFILEFIETVMHCFLQACNIQHLCLFMVYLHRYRIERPMGWKRVKEEDNQMNFHIFSV